MPHMISSTVGGNIQHISCSLRLEEFGRRDELLLVNTECLYSINKTSDIKAGGNMVTITNKAVNSRFDGKLNIFIVSL